MNTRNTRSRWRRSRISRIGAHRPRPGTADSRGEAGARGHRRRSPAGERWLWLDDGEDVAVWVLEPGALAVAEDGDALVVGRDLLVVVPLERDAVRGQFVDDVLEVIHRP